MHKLFNPNATDINCNAFYGTSTGLININNPSYPWAVHLYKQMRQNIWDPYKTDLTDDIAIYPDLTPEEKRGFEGTLAYLIYLDSIQIHNLNYLTQPCTAPELSLLFAEQISQEGVHNHSYSYIVETVIPADKRDKIYTYWEEDKVLKERCRLIATHYQEYIDNPNPETHTVSLFGDFILESLLFYTGFYFFYNLSSRNLMNATSSMFSLINRDELSHVRFHQKLVEEKINNQPQLKDKLSEMFFEAAEQEKLWNFHILGDNILGLSVNAINQFIEYLTNLRLVSIGLDRIYSEQKNPFKHLDRIANVSNEATVKDNFFGTNLSTYQLATVLEGWEDI